MNKQTNFRPDLTIFKIKQNHINSEQLSAILILLSSSNLLVTSPDPNVIPLVVT